MDQSGLTYSVVSLFWPKTVVRSGQADTLRRRQQGGLSGMLNSRQNTKHACSETSSPGVFRRSSGFPGVPPWRQRLNRCPRSPFCLGRKQQLLLPSKCVTTACWAPGASSPARSLLPTAPLSPPSILGSNSYLSGGDAALIVRLVCQQERDTAMRLCTLLRDI